MAGKISTGWGPKLKGSLADYANASKGTILLGSIQAHMIKEASKPSDRRQDIIHPSETSKEDWCPRSTYYRIKTCREAQNPFLKPPGSTTSSVQLLNIFDEGHYIHDKWQKRLRDMGDLWGNWKCMECGSIYEDDLYPGVCTHCNSINIKYLEVPLRFKPFLISGHADGAIPRLKSLIEIKSVGTGTARIEAPKIFEANTDGQMINLQGLWKDIQEPFPSHIKQGQLYLALCNLMELDFDQIIFLYEAKFNQGAKEFVVKYDPAVSRDILENCMRIAHALEGNGSVPLCPNDTCKDCEIYSGTQTERIDGMGSTADDERAESNRSAIRRSPGPAARIVRPS